MPFSIPPLDSALDAALQNKIDQKTKPLGSLGQLEKLALQLGRIQQTLTPKLAHPHLLVFAGDHGAARAGVSAFPQDVTWQMVENFLAGGAAINVFARLNGLQLKVIDAGVAHDFGLRQGLIDASMGRGTRSYLDEPAMSSADVTAALARGAAIAYALADEGCKVVGFGDMGIGNTASASLITHILTGTPLTDCIGRGTGLDDDGLARKRALLAQAVPRAAMLLLIDGFIVTAALLAASRLAPGIRDYCIYCHRSAEPGHRAQLHDLRAEPLLDLGLRLGEGTGAALAWPLVQAAAAFLNEMASFESAGVSEKS